MAAALSRRIWATMTDEEAEEVAKAAEARGMKPPQLIRMAVLSLIRQAPPDDATAVGAVPPRLEALVEVLGQHVAAIGLAVPTLEDARAEREAVQGSLQDIARAVGTLAGSIEPPDSASSGAGHF